MFVKITLTILVTSSNSYLLNVYSFPSHQRDVFDPPSPSPIQVWIARLEAEVNRFNSENTALVKLKMEREEVGDVGV